MLGVEKLTSGVRRVPEGLVGAAIKENKIFFFQQPKEITPHVAYRKKKSKVEFLF